MIPDAAKIVTLRTQQGYTQEKLALLANVTPRTIQRLEAGNPVQIETINQVAAPLGVLAADIIQPISAESIPEGDDGIILKPSSSGLHMVEHIIAAESLDFGVAFEPWPEQTAIVMPFLRRLEELDPHTFEHISEYDWTLQSSAAASRVQAAALLNADIKALAELKPQGLYVLFGNYAVLGRKWHWDNYEGCWCTGGGQREEVLQIAALRIVPASVRQQRIPLKGKPVQSTGCTYGSGEIPF